MRAVSLVLPAQLEPEPQGSLPCPEVTFYFYSLGEGSCKPLSFRSFLGLYILLNFLSFMCLPLPPGKSVCVQRKQLHSALLRYDTLSSPLSTMVS